MDDLAFFSSYLKISDRMRNQNLVAYNSSDALLPSLLAAATCSFQLSARGVEDLVQGLQSAFWAQQSASDEQYQGQEP